MFLQQYTDGIMGLAHNPSGVAAALTGGETSNSFSLFTICFTPTGGSLGLLTEPPPDADYANIKEGGDGFYGVTVVRVMLGVTSIADVGGSALKAFNRNRGVVIDSGTTDTYLPKVVRGEFEEAWRRETGWEHDNEPRRIGKEEFERLPDLVFKVEGGGEIRVTASR